MLGQRYLFLVWFEFFLITKKEVTHWPQFKSPAETGFDSYDYYCI